MLCFLALSAFDTWKSRNQKKLIVYNVPQYQAIDIVQGNKYKFIGDSILLQDGLLQNFHLKPARVKLQLTKRVLDLPGLFAKQSFYSIGNKTIFILDNPLIFEPLLKKVNVDCIVVSKNIKIDLLQLSTVFNCKYYVFDASNSLWKIDKWKKDCEELHLQYHSIPEKGYGFCMSIMIFLRWLVLIN